MNSKSPLIFAALLAISSPCMAFTVYHAVDEAVPSDTGNSVQAGTSVSKTDEQSLQIFRSKQDLECRGRLIEIGDHQVLPKTASKGRKLSINDAVVKVIPNGWSVENVDINPSQTISWNKTDRFDKILSLMAKVTNTCITINWNDRSVTLESGQRTSSRVVTTSSQDGDKKFDRFVEDYNGRASADRPDFSAVLPPSSPPAPIDDLQTWTLEENKTLAENLDAWGKRAGWRVVWNAKGIQYPITHAATVHGDFMHALEEVMGAYEDATDPLAAQVHDGNRVVEIIYHSGYKRHVIGQ